MARHGIVDPKNGEVVNVVVWEGAEWLPPRGYAVCENPLVDIGDKYDIDSGELIKRFFIAEQPAE